MNKYEPCKEQKELMESLGFTNTHVDDKIPEQFMKVKWARTHLTYQPPIYLLMDINYIPNLQSVIWDIINVAYKEGQTNKINEIKKALNICECGQEL